MRRQHLGLAVILAFTSHVAHSQEGVEGVVPATLRSERLDPAIESQPLVDALEIFAKATRLQLIYRAERSNGVVSRGTPGGVSWEEALQRLLAGTGLTYAFVNERTITILLQDPALTGTRGDSSGNLLGHDNATVPSSADVDAYGKLQIPNDRYDVEEVNRVVITGSHIPGIDPVGTRVIRIDRQQIDEGGYTTIADALRSLTQVWAGGPNEHVSPGPQSSQESLFNAAKAEGLNLRGLGAGSTLVLINGRRMAAAAGDGRFVDVSGIPLSAIDRIEIMPEGASAIYGADAVGGVVNFVLRQDYVGAETVVAIGTGTDNGPAQSRVAQMAGTVWGSGSGLLSFDYWTRAALPASARRQSANSDLRELGGSNWNTPEGNPATITIGEETFAIPQEQDGTSLSVDDLLPGVNLHNVNEGRDLLPDHMRWSIMGTFGQQFGARTQIFADVLLTDRQTQVVQPATRLQLTVPASNPFNPFDTAASVSYAFDDDFGHETDDVRATNRHVTLGAEIDLTPRWRIMPSISYTASREKILVDPAIDEVALNAALSDPNPETAFNPFGDGSFTNADTLAHIRVSGLLRRRAELWTGGMTADGVLFQVADREVRLATGAEQRRQLYSSFGERGAVNVATGRGDRDVTAVYAEFLVPIFGQQHRWAGAEKLELSMAGRYEEYSDAGSTVMPRFGIAWSPLSAVTLRGAWSESFRAPTLIDLDESVNFAARLLQKDPAVPGQLSPVLVWFGNNADLRAERASTWTLGADVTWPSRLLTAGITYFNINHEQRVERIGYSSTLLHDPTFADLVRPSEDRELVCARARFIGNATDCLNAPITAVIDARLANVAAMTTRGVDLYSQHEWSGFEGMFQLTMDVAYLFDYRRARSRTSLAQELVSTQGNPMDLRVRASVRWMQDPLTVRADVNYSDDYRDTASNPHRSVQPWTTADVGVHYKIDERSSWLSGAILKFKIENVFDESPPFFNNPIGVGYDEEVAYLEGRTVIASLMKRW